MRPNHSTAPKRFYNVRAGVSRDLSFRQNYFRKRKQPCETQSDDHYSGAGNFMRRHSFAQTPNFNIVKPSTTGVPGEEVRTMKFDPAGNLWISGRFYFWGEVGLAMLSADRSITSHYPEAGSTRAHGRFGRACIIRSRRLTLTTWNSAPVACSGLQATVA